MNCMCVSDFRCSGWVRVKINLRWFPSRRMQWGAWITMATVYLRGASHDCLGSPRILSTTSGWSPALQRVQRKTCTTVCPQRHTVTGESPPRSSLLLERYPRVTANQLRVSVRYNGTTAEGVGLSLRMAKWLLTQYPVTQTQGITAFCPRKQCCLDMWKILHIREMIVKSLRPDSRLIP